MRINSAWETTYYDDNDAGGLTLNLHPDDEGHLLMARLAEYLYYEKGTMGTDEVDIGSGARIFADGTFRHFLPQSGTTADLAITTQTGAFSATDKSFWLDITAIANWTTTRKTWTESNAQNANMATVHTVGDLNASTYYTVTVTAADASAIAGSYGTSCSTVDGEAVCLSSSTGSLSFAYNGGFTSSHTFDMSVGDNAAPTNFGLASITPDSTSQLTVTAQTAVDAGSGLSLTPYVFTETSGHPGASSSNWQASTAFVDTGLSANTQYTYKVKARDETGNISAFSSTLSAYTLAPTPTNLTVTINDTSASVAADILANATAGSSGYYFSRADGGNSGWIQNYSWQDTDISCGRSYTYSVRYRNGDGVETAALSLSVTTANCSGGGGSRGGGGSSPRIFRTPVVPSPSSPEPDAATTTGSQDSSLPNRDGFLTVTTQDRSIVYRDIAVTAWFAPYVYDILSRNIAAGYQDTEGRLLGLFGPGNPVTYAEILKMALHASAKTSSLSPAASPLNLSARATWAAPYVALAEAMGISVMTSDLSVHTPARRGEVLAIILEVYGTTVGSSPASAFSDVPADHPYAAAIATAAALGLVSGDTSSDGALLHTFRPDAPINRAEIAKIVSRSLGIIQP